MKHIKKFIMKWVIGRAIKNHDGLDSELKTLTIALMENAPKIAIKNQCDSDNYIIKKKAYGVKIDNFKFSIMFLECSNK